jgi:hypothetical protein
MSIPVDITPYIRELLLRNQKVTLPGFGSLCIRHRPAELSKQNHLLLPPSNEVVFDPKLLSDDDLLAGYLVKVCKMRKPEAEETIRHFVESLHEEVAMATGPSVLAGIGSFTREKSGYTRFKPVDELLKQISLFELPKLEVKNIRSIAPPPEETVKVVKTYDRSKPKKKRWWIAAAFLILIAGAAVYFYYSGIYRYAPEWIRFGNRNAKSGESADLLVFGTRNNNETDTLQERISREIDEKTNRENALAYQGKQEEPADEGTITSIEKKDEFTGTFNKPYHIIAGSFLVPNNAELKKEQLEKMGFFPLVLPPRGDYYMVSMGSYQTSEEAMTVIQQLKSKLKQDLWVMKID